MCEGERKCVIKKLRNMPRLVVALAFGLGLGLGLTSGTDECETGSYHDVNSDSCNYCMNAPLGAFYTGNGNYTSECPYEMCESCDQGEYRKGCGYDDQTNEPATICFAMNEVADICSAGPKYCTVQPTDYTAYDTCSDYCDSQGLSCLASYTSSDGGCGEDIFSLDEGSCFDNMDESSVCGCHLDTCSADLHSTGILQCDYYAGTADYCPSATTTASLENQIWAAQNCRVSCGLCVSGESWDEGVCVGCSSIEEGTEGLYYSSDGDRSDSCDVTDCTQQCYLGEYNAGCGFDNFKEDTFSCALCKDHCGEGNYISSVCDGSGFLETTECSACSNVCAIGFYIGEYCDGTTTTDTTSCVPCTATCNPGYYIEGEFCTGTEFESQAECVACTQECEAGYYPVGYCDGTGSSNEVSCVDCSDCDQTCEGDECNCFEACFTITVLGGSGNWALNYFDAVGGGENNQAGFMENDASGLGEDDEFNVVVGGASNTAGGQYSSVGGGGSNVAFGVGVTVAGGQSNIAASGSAGDWSLGVEQATIGGGKDNTASDDYAVVMGGENNQATSDYSGAIGGKDNEATGSYSVVIGGKDNSVRGSWSGIGGGRLNKAIANYATCPGGYLGKASARFSVVLGGSKNTAKGRYSFAAGFTAKATKDYSGVLGFSGDTCKDNGSGSFNICADYVYINGYDVTDLLATASGRRSRRLTDGSEKHLNDDAEMRRLARDMGYTLEAVELDQELAENDIMMKTIDEKMERAMMSLKVLDSLIQPASSLRSK